jgi:hypothetical protein
MRFTCRLLAALCCLSIGAAGIATAEPVTDVVFGNLGSSGTNAVDTGDTALVGSSTQGQLGNAYAVAFKTGTDASFLQLQSITMGFSDVEPYSTALLTVVQDNAGQPTGTQVASASKLLGSTGLFTFSLGSVTLSPNSTYWVTLAAQNAGDPNQFNWLRNVAADSFTGQNGSGYDVPGAIFVRRSLNGGEWNNFTGSGGALSMSVQAVPEPSTYALAALGLGVAGFVRARRRKSAV